MFITVCTEEDKKLFRDDPGIEGMGEYVPVKVCTQDIGDDDPYGLVHVQCSVDYDQYIIEASDKIKDGEIPVLSLKEAW